MTMDDEYKKRVDEFFFWPEGDVPRAQLVLNEIAKADERRKAVGC